MLIILLNTLISNCEAIIKILARYKELPFKAKAKIIKPGIVYNILEFWFMKSSSIAGSSKYAIAEVLAAKRSEKKTDKNILGKYFFV